MATPDAVRELRQAAVEAKESRGGRAWGEILGHKPAHPSAHPPLHPPSQPGQTLGRGATGFTGVGGGAHQPALAVFPVPGAILARLDQELRAGHFLDLRRVGDTYVLVESRDARKRYFNAL